METRNHDNQRWLAELTALVTHVASETPYDDLAALLAALEPWLDDLPPWAGGILCEHVDPEDRGSVEGWLDAVFVWLDPPPTLSPAWRTSSGPSCRPETVASPTVRN